MIIRSHFCVGAAVLLTRREPLDGGDVRARCFAELGKELGHTLPFNWTSISHQDGRTAYGASTQGPLGIDLCSGEPDLRILDLFHELERDRPPQCLRRAWASKEAVLKLVGCGIVDGVEWPRLDGLDLGAHCLLANWRLGPHSDGGRDVMLEGFSIDPHTWLALAQWA
jgi:4'-phosphopantetheinyl transferase superfamily